jgi:hypothetical protein
MDGMIMTGKTEELGYKPVLMILFHTNPTWTDADTNPGAQLVLTNVPNEVALKNMATRDNMTNNV